MRWLVLLLLTLALSVGCDLNPQPEVPGSDEPAAGGSAGATGSAEAAGAAGSAGAPGGWQASGMDSQKRRPDPDVDSDESDSHLHAGREARSDAGPERDGGTDAAPAPPVVVQ